MKYPIIYQENHYDCGPACIFMLCEYYNIPYNKNLIIKKAQMCDRGTNIYNMNHILSLLGFNTSAVLVDDLNLYVFTNPFIAIIRLSENKLHYVIVYERIQNLLVIGNPALGLQYINIDVFLINFTGLVIVPIYNN